MLQGWVRQNRLFHLLKNEMQISLVYFWSQNFNAYRVDIEMAKLTNAVCCKFGGAEEREKSLKEAFKVCMEARYNIWPRHTQSMCASDISDHATNRSLTKMVLEH